MQTASALDTGDVREGQRPDRVRWQCGLAENTSSAAKQTLSFSHWVALRPSRLLGGSIFLSLQWDGHNSPCSFAVMISNNVSQE